MISKDNLVGTDYLKSVSSVQSEVCAKTSIFHQSKSQNPQFQIGCQA